MRVRLQRSTGVVVLDTELALPDPGGERVVEAAVEIEGDMGTVIEHTFDYVDPNGDVPDPVNVTYQYSYSPTRNDTYTNQLFARSGTAFAGTVTVGYCHIFGADTQITETMQIQDTAGSMSNSLTASTSRPVGANSAGLSTTGGPARQIR